MLSSRTAVSEEQKQVFMGELQKAVQKELKRLGRVYLSVDYGPDRMLAEAADKANIAYAAFPVKTSMWVSEGSVKVAYGYGKEAKEIYSEAQADRQPGQ